MYNYHIEILGNKTLKQEWPERKNNQRDKLG